ncbi:MAG: hypothetical protein JOY96_06260, partial [Verrucomicrobia bacterium]|nr:hypothetical protein [Verrucomicrobiota bacterium]
MSNKALSSGQLITGQEFLRTMGARLFLVAVSLFYISPIYWMGVTALKSDQELSRFPPLLIPANPVWENFRQATNTFPFLNYLA